MTRESWREVAARTVAALGGLILWSPKPLAIGAIVRGISTMPLCSEAIADQPFVIVGEATEDQWLRQMSFVGLDGRRSRKAYYYFVQTD